MQTDLILESSHQLNDLTKNLKSSKSYEIDQQKLDSLIAKTGLKRQDFQNIINNLKGQKFDYGRLLIQLMKQQIPLKSHQFLFVLKTIHSDMIYFVSPSQYYIGDEQFLMFGIQQQQGYGIIQKLSQQLKSEKTCQILKSIAHINFPNLLQLNVKNNSIVSMQSLPFIHLSNLKIINLGDNLITSGKPLAKCNFSKLTMIGIQQNQIENKSIFEALHRCKTSKLFSYAIPQLGQVIYNFPNQFITMHHNDYSSIVKLLFEAFCTQSKYLKLNQVTIWLPNISHNRIFKLGDKLNKSIEQKFNSKNIIYTQNSCLQQQSFEEDQRYLFDDW